MSARDPVYSATRPVRLWARFEPPLVDKLDLYAEHKGTTRAGLMRLIIEQWLAARPDVPEGAPIVGERSYDQSRYMRERQEARERAAMVAAAERAINEAQGGLKEQWREIAQTLEQARAAVQAAADLGEGN